MAEPALAVVIVGAGVHAAVVAVRLLHEWPELRDRLRFIDPAGVCLADWQRRSWGQGMEVMRSPGAHHLDVPAESLLGYARAHGREHELLAPYHRPSLSLFMDHSRWVIERHRLEELIIPATVVDIELDDDGYTLHCANAPSLTTRTVILAPGLRGHERLPAWAGDLVRGDAGIAVHAESLDIRREDVVGDRILVVGGGLSAATLTDAAATRGAHVTLVSRHPLEARLFDADPGWVGPKYLTVFQNEPEPEARLRMIRRARGRGSVTPELLARLRAAQAEGRVEIREEVEVAAAHHDERRRSIHVLFGGGAGETPYGRIWCATGFEPSVERLPWLGRLRPRAHCHGRPLVGPSLELAPGCFVTGWLAELWVGPAARNISGARHAARLIVDVLRARDIIADHAEVAA